MSCKKVEPITYEQLDNNKLAQYIAFCDVRDCPEFNYMED